MQDYRLRDNLSGESFTSLQHISFLGFNVAHLHYAQDKTEVTRSYGYAQLPFKDSFMGNVSKDHG